MKNARYTHKIMLLALLGLCTPQMAGFTVPEELKPTYNTLCQLYKTGSNWIGKNPRKAACWIGGILAGCAVVWKTTTFFLDRWFPSRRFKAMAQKFTAAERKRFEPFPTLADNGQSEQTLITKLHLDADSDLKIFTDIHGNIDHLEDIIDQLKEEEWLTEDLKIVNDNRYLVFLGDAVDRGKHNYKVWNRLLELEEKNPDKVILIRGNHEDVTTAGFAYKYPYHRKPWLAEFYNCLPSACYVTWNTTNQGKKCVILCHGAPNVCFDSRDFLAGDNTRTLFNYREAAQRINLGAAQRINLGAAQANVTKEANKTALDTCWNIFSQHTQNYGSDPFQWIDLLESDETLLWKNQRGFGIGNNFMADYLQTVSPEGTQIVGIIRGHQHQGFRRELADCHGVHFAWHGRQCNGLNTFKLTEFSRENPLALTIDGHCNHNARNTIVTLKLRRNFDDCEICPQAI